MKVNNLKTKNKNIVNLEELHALSSAYGNRLNRKEIFSIVGYPAIVLSLFVFFLTYRWWTTLIAVIFGVIWGFKFILPQTINRRYESQSLSARNSFVNSLTQRMTDGNRTVLDSLELTVERVSGELLEDLKSLVLALKIGSDQDRVRHLLSKFSEKYPEDIVLAQYLEQLETKIFEGNQNIDSLQQLTNDHNMYLIKREEFLNFKDLVFKGIQKIIMLLMVIIALCHGVSYGLAGNFDVYIYEYTKNITGYVTVPIFLINIITSLNTFFKKYFDDSVTELTVRTRK